MKGNHMKDVQEIIAELQRRGPIDETEFYRVEGALLRKSREGFIS